MAALDLTALARQNGFQATIRAIMFDVARDKATAATGDDLSFVNGILNGENSVFQLALGVAVVNGDPAADDASLKTTVEAVWPFYAKAWAARVV